MPPIRGRKAASSTAAPGSRPNTIGAGQSELGSLLDDMDRQQAGAGLHAQRVHSRWPFRHAATTLVLEHPGGSTATCTVACRNLSCGGASLLHGAFTHPGTRCCVHLAKLDGSVREARGVVVRCTHVRGRVHELGVRFDGPIALREHVELDLLAGRSVFERVEASALMGSLAAVLPDAIDQRVLQHFLSDSHVTLCLAESFDQLRSSDGLDRDGIVLDVERVPLDEAARALEEAGTPTPVIALGARCPADLAARLGARGGVTFVRKPILQEALLAAVADCLLAPGRLEGRPPAPGEVPPAIRRWTLASIAQRVEDLRAALAAQDALRSYSACQELRFLALQLGAPGAASAADAAATRLALTMSVPESMHEVSRLLGACDAESLRKSA